MTDLQITCDNCGAKYKLPASFTGSQAKCQKCGSVIDVQKQRAAATGTNSAAAAKPAAAARPAIDRSKQAPTPAAKPAAATASGSRRGKDAKAGADQPASGGKRERPDRGERGERSKAKSSSMPMLVAGLGLLVIGGGAAFFLLRGGDQPATLTTAKNDATPTPAAAKVEPATADTATADAAKPAAVDPAKIEPTKIEPTKPAEPPAAAPADASAPVVPDDPTRVKKPWEKMRNPPQSMDQVADPKSYGEVTWPEGTDEAKKTEIRELTEEVAGGGRPGIKAKPKLVQIGYLSMFGIVEKLRTLDYKSAEQSQLAFEFNKVLEEITGNLNARFEPVEANEELIPTKAEWNTRSVKGWLDLLSRFPDEDAFKKDKAARLAKQADK